MIPSLVWASMRQRPGRSLLLLLGYALGVGVTVALLSIGDALVEQSRDRDLLGGGDLLVLPAGIDLETLRTGGVSSLYFTLDQARFYYREVLTGPRFAGEIEAVAPWLEDELLYLESGSERIAVSAGGHIPSAAQALGASPDLIDGRWEDAEADRLWMGPEPAERLREIDAFRPTPQAAAGDSTWAEWHYFNLVSPDESEWIYLTFLAGGDVPDGEWGGRVLLTYVHADGAQQSRFIDVAREDIELQFDRPDLEMGDSYVRLRPDGTYEIRATVTGGGGELGLEVLLEPELHRYLPPVNVSPGGFPSGYVVPVLRGTASGSVCVDGSCSEWENASAYHDHNWGVWRDVTWDWGHFEAGDLSILYGGVRQSTEDGTDRSGGRFAFVVDSLGLAATLPIRQIEYEWNEDGPTRMRLEASLGGQSLRLDVPVDHWLATEQEADGRSRMFYQLRGTAEVDAVLVDGPVSGRGTGSFETWTTR
jgi:hypothetical protein